jgi:hypothetical protein
MSSKKFDMERFNLKKLNDIEVKSIRLKFQISMQLWKMGIINNDYVRISRAWESIRENIKVSTTRWNSINFDFMKSAQKY